MLACKVALEGREPVPPVEDEPLDVVVVVPLPPEEEPDLGGYLSPVLAQLPDSGASKRVVSKYQVLPGLRGAFGHTDRHELAVQ